MEEVYKLFYDNINLVRSIVNKINYGYVDKEDLMQAGLIGLFSACKNYEASKNTSFSSYATYYILGEIKKETRMNQRIILSKDMYKLIKAIKENGNSTIDELCQITNNSRDNILLALSYKEHTISLNKEEENNELLDTISQDVKNTKVTLKDVKSCLDGDLYTIIYNKYFLGETQSELAKNLNRSQSKISRLEKRALVILKKYCLEQGY